MPAAAPLVALAVAVLSGVYAAAVYVPLGARLRGLERLGFALILGALLLATSNNFLTAALGSRAAGVADVTIPLAVIAWHAARGRWRDAAADARATLPRAAAAASACAIALFALSYHLVAETTMRNGLHPDLPWHIGRAAQQGFAGSPWTWPLSPLAFPSPLPYVSFAADALVSATLRCVPIDVDGMQYVQALWCWTVVFWIGAVLVAGRGAVGTLTLIATASLVVPAVLWGADRVALIVFVFFYANPNSAIAWPMGLALALYLHRCYRERIAPSTAVVLAIAPASLFVKANQAPAFAFLQAIGIALWLRGHDRRTDIVRRTTIAAALWIAAIGATLMMGAWPPGRGVHPAFANFAHYAAVALDVPRSWRHNGANLVAFVALVAAAQALAPRTGSARERWMPIVTLVASIVFVAAAWFSVVPNDLAEGEPMHVNFELIMWIGTVLIADALWSWPRHAPRRVVAAAVGAWCVWSLWTVNARAIGVLPELAPYTGATRATIDTIRRQLSTRIDAGSCFAYGRRFVIDVTGPGDPDHAIAATGCPVINGRRWRGYLGDNRPEELRQQPAIVASGGKRFTIVPLAAQSSRSTIIGSTRVASRAGR